MDNITLSATCAYIIDTLIKVIKPLIPDERKQLIPVLVMLMGVLCGVLFFEGTILEKIARGIGIGTAPTAMYETTKVFK